MTYVWKEHGPEMEPALCEFEEGGCECNRLATYFRPGGEVQFLCDEHKNLIEERES